MKRVARNPMQRVFSFSAALGGAAPVNPCPRSARGGAVFFIVVWPAGGGLFFLCLGCGLWPFFFALRVAVLVLSLRGVPRTPFFSAGAVCFWLFFLPFFIDVWAVFIDVWAVFVAI